MSCICFLKWAKGGKSYECYACIGYGSTFTDSMDRILENFPTTEPKLKKLRKDKTLKRCSLLQVGDHTGLLIAEFDNKSKMNKYLKALTLVRRDVTADTGLQAWAYTGAVRASG